MRRRLINFFTALSLLVCVAVIVLWVRSHWTWDFFEGGTYDVSGERPVLTMWGGGMADGGVTIGRLREVWLTKRPPWLNRPPPRWAWETTPAEQVLASPDGTLWARFGFHYENGTTPGEPVVHDFTVAFPLWLPAAALAALPAAWSIRRFPRRRRVGLCPACGYDLRGSPD